MRVVVIGNGIQGKKRKEHAGKDYILTVDPDFKYSHTIETVPIKQYDAACVCTPNDVKIDIIDYLLSNKKHVLVEKPLHSDIQSDLVELQYLAVKQHTVLYAAYNHRFEPSLIYLKDLIDSKKLGKIYHCRIFYGNGTAKLVKESPWRDKGIGIFGEIGSHLLDMTRFLFGKGIITCPVVSSHTFENETPDHFVVRYDYDISFELEATYCSWKNTFTCDIVGERGSAHIDGLCKWGPSSLVWRERVLPSGIPESHEVSWEMGDPTWDTEYTHFKNLCGGVVYEPEWQRDLSINYMINKLSAQSKEGK